MKPSWKPAVAAATVIATGMVALGVCAAPAQAAAPANTTTAVTHVNRSAAQVPGSPWSLGTLTGISGISGSMLGNVSGSALGNVSGTSGGMLDRTYDTVSRTAADVAGPGSAPTEAAFASVLARVADPVVAAPVPLAGGARVTAPVKAAVAAPAVSADSIARSKLWHQTLAEFGILAAAFALFARRSLRPRSARRSAAGVGAGTGAGTGAKHES